MENYWEAAASTLSKSINFHSSLKHEHTQKKKKKKKSSLKDKLLRKLIPSKEARIK
jgi:hypothetical protein